MPDVINERPETFEASRFTKIIDSTIAELQNLKYQYSYALNRAEVAEENLKECKKAHNETAQKATHMIQALKNKIKESK